MAAAEARTAWQRAANRYFVQEDAKRAPKLACCQSSNQSSKQPDPSNTGFVDGMGHPPVGGFRPLDRTPSFSILTPDSKWWLQMQPNYGPHQMGSNPDHHRTDVAEIDSLQYKMGDESVCSLEYVDMGPTLDGKKHHDVGPTLDGKKHHDVGPNLDGKKHHDVGPTLEGKVDQDQADVRDMTEYYELLEMEMVGGGLGSKTTSGLSSNSDSWEKMPWWRVTDGDELASFVAQKSLHHVENCDLPRPQKVSVRNSACKTSVCVDHDEVEILSRGWEVRSDSISGRSFGGSENEDGSAELLRTTTTTTTPRDGRQTATDPSKAQLLEALCHSQTRAREAEKAAKQAHTEKEHLLKLFFRQASQLFAYKQWFKLLQRESLVLQTEDGESKQFTLLPCMPPLKQRKVRKNCVRPVRGRRHRRGSRGGGCDIGKYCVAFALGFTLVGAGLILGWTVGWLLL